jgi:hypothetical protein
MRSPHKLRVTLLCVLTQTIKRLTDFRETWNEDFTTGSYLTSYFFKFHRPLITLRLIAGARGSVVY